MVDIQAMKPGSFETFGDGDFIRKKSDGTFTGQKDGEKIRFDSEAEAIEAFASSGPRTTTNGKPRTQRGKAKAPKED
ncbi:hypothetical protein [Roseibium sp.]|uniref:hypothetical protein n=1 Tax=Roseibium sp. TaxID=1936156 RepID=UPI003283804B